MYTIGYYYGWKTALGQLHGISISVRKKFLFSKSSFADFNINTPKYTGQYIIGGVNESIND